LVRLSTISPRVKGFALVKVVFPPEQLRQALIPFGPVMGLATVAGPILAG